MSVGLQPGLGGIEEGSRRRRMGRWSIGHLAVAVAAILAFVANLAFLRARDDMSTVVVAARPIPAGETVGPGDLATDELRADAAILSTLLTSVEGVDGLVVRRALAAGELVGSADLLSEPAPDGLASMSVPIDDAHAAGGTIRVGDRVDVIDVDGEGAAGYVVRDAPVLAVSDEAAGAFTAAGGGHIVLGLDDDQVLNVAEAIADGEVDVVVTTGAGR